MSEPKTVGAHGESFSDIIAKRVRAFKDEEAKHGKGPNAGPSDQGNQNV